jgi:hypothetical protein
VRSALPEALRETDRRGRLDAVGADRAGFVDRSLDVNTAEKLVSEFDRMVRHDGGEVSLLGVDETTVRVGYRPGKDEECEGDVCILPHLELQQLMSETLSRRDPQLRVVVELLP